MHRRPLALALATALVALSAPTLAQQPAKPVPQTPEAWLQRMTDFTQNASVRDPKVFVPWVNAVSEPGFFLSMGTGMIDPASWLNMMNSMATPDAVRNWVGLTDPRVLAQWSQAGADPAFYTNLLGNMTDPGKVMRWAMLPTDPKLWKLPVQMVNPNTYIRWGMAGMDPRTWNLIGNVMNPALYTGMMGAVVDPRGQLANPWLSWRPPAPVVGASNPWGGEYSSSFNMFDPALLSNLTTFLPSLLPGMPSLPGVPGAAPAAKGAPAAPAAAAPAPAPVAAPAVTAAPAPAPAVAPGPDKIAAAPLAPLPAGALHSKLTLSGDTLFPLGRSALKDLSPAGKQALDELVAKIKQAGEIERVVIVGHADASGKAAANQKLSEARARAIKSYLVAKGVKAGSITAGGVGAREPVANCDMKLPGKELAECLAPNRRVEVQIFGKGK